MLWSVKSLSGYTMLATDGEIGNVEEFLFDDGGWLISYLVVNTGNWLTGRNVLISPIAIDPPDWTSRQFPVNLSKEQVKNNPDIDVAQPISRQRQAALHDHYAWPYYWQTDEFHPLYPPLPSHLIPKEEESNISQRESESRESHLRSTGEVIGYHIQANDGEIGHVEDFIVEEDLWLIRYMVVDTRNWLPGKKVLIPPTWIAEISWAEKSVSIDLSREKVKESPEYNPSDPVNREYEIRFYDYYGRPKYWQER